MSGHILSKHKEYSQQFVDAKEKKETLKAEKVAKELEQKSDVGFGDLKQSKLMSDKDNNLSVNIIRDPHLQAKWDKQVVIMVAESFMTFRQAEFISLPFSVLWSNSRGKVKIRSHHTISRHTAQFAQELNKDVLRIIMSNKSEISSVGFTADLWRNRYLQSFLSLTIHLMTKDFQLIKLVPFMSYMEEPHHTGLNIKLKIDDFLEKLGLDSNDIWKTITVDNAPSNKVAVRLSPGLEPYWCAVHTIQLSVGDVLKLSVNLVDIQDILDKTLAIAKYVKSSEPRKQLLEAACNQTNVQFLMPTIPTEVRWNSKFDNMESVLRLRGPLQLMCAQDTDGTLPQIMLSASEFNVAEGMCKALKFVKIASKKWQSDFVPTLPMVIVELYNMKHELKLLGKHPSSEVSIFARLLKQKIEERFPHCGTSVKLNRMAHYLDPKYRGAILHEFPGTYQQAREEVKLICSKYDHDQTSQIAEVQEDNTDQEMEGLTFAEKLVMRKRRMSGDIVGGPSSKLSKVEVELQSYENMQVPKISPSI